VITLATNEHPQEQHILVRAYNAAIATAKSKLYDDRIDREKNIPGYQYFVEGARNSELTLSNDECLAVLRAWKQKIGLAYNTSGAECGITLSTANKLEISMDDILRSITLETKRGNSLEISDLKNNVVISNAKSITGIVKDTIDNAKKVKDVVKQTMSSPLPAKERLNELRKKVQAKAIEAIKEKIAEPKDSLNSIIIETDGGKSVLMTASGCKAEIDERSDSITMDAPGDITINAGGNLTISAQKEISIRGQEDMTIASEKCTVIKGKNEMVVTGSAARVESKRGGVKVHSEGEASIKGATIHLNKPGAKASGGKGAKSKGSNKNTKKIPYQGNAKSIFKR
jgi:hypothetical protein